MLTGSLLTALLLLPQTAPAPGAPSAPARQGATRDVSALLGELRKDSGVPGLVGAVVHGDVVTALGASGVRKLGDETPLTLDDRMHLGSCTKAMTATLAAQFVEQGKLRWDTTLPEVFPKLELQADWKKVTLEMLLTNRSGAPADLERDGLWAALFSSKAAPREQRAQLLAGVVKHPPESPPGTKFLYSNAGFAIAGHMLETLAKKPWEELLQEQLFRPLAITQAGFGAPGKAGKLDQPLGHRGRQPIEPGPGADNPAAIGPAGTAHMPVGDWARFVALHLDGARGKPRLLTAESFAKLHTGVRDGDTNYAMGWGVGESAELGGRVLEHAGSNTMWYCIARIAPERGIAVLVMSNQGGNKASALCGKAADALFEAELALGAGKEPGK